MYLEFVGDHGEPVHANDSIHVCLGVGDVNAIEDHAIQGHDARVDHDMAGGVDNGQIVAQVAPGDMGQGVVVVAGGRSMGASFPRPQAPVAGSLEKTLRLTE